MVCYKLGRMEGIEEREKGGMEIGEMKERLKVAVQLKRQEVDQFVILKSTEISEEELESL